MTQGGTQMNSDIYTITRLADELQHDRQTIRRRIEKLGIEAINEDTRTYQNEPLEYDVLTYLRLAESFGISVSNSDDTTDDTAKDELIEVLKSQLEVANEEKRELRNLLDQQQRLNMSDKSRIELLELEIEEKPNEQKGFFARLFNL